MKNISQKTCLIFLFLIVLALISPLVYAQDELQLGNPFEMAWQPIKSIFEGAQNISPEDRNTVMRFIVFLVMFTVAFGVFKWLASSSKGFEWLGGNVGLILAGAIAAMGVIFIPENALNGIGTSYGQIAMLILFLPILGMLIFLIVKTENHWFKLALLLMALYMIAYFNMFFKASEFADESIGGLVFRVLSSVISIWMIIELFGGLGSFSFFGGGEGGGGFHLPGRGDGGGGPSKQEQKAQKAVGAALNVSDTIGKDIQTKLQDLANRTTTLADLFRAFSNELGRLARGPKLNKATMPAELAKLNTFINQANDNAAFFGKELAETDDEFQRITLRVEQSIEELKKTGKNQVFNSEINELSNELVSARREMEVITKIRTEHAANMVNFKNMLASTGDLFKAFKFYSYPASHTAFETGSKQFDGLARVALDIQTKVNNVRGNFTRMENAVNRIKQKVGQYNQMVNAGVT